MKIKRVYKVNKEQGDIQTENEKDKESGERERIEEESCLN